MSNKKTNTIQGLLKERDRLLVNHPDLIKYQMEIDQILARLETKDPEIRAQKLNEMLLNKLLNELLPAKDELRRIQAKIKELEDAA